MKHAFAVNLESDEHNGFIECACGWKGEPFRVDVCVTPTLSTQLHVFLPVLNHLAEFVPLVPGLGF